MVASPDDALNKAELDEVRNALNLLRQELNNVLYGQSELIDFVIMGLISRGHILLEGLPGLGKTELVKGLAGALGLDSKRVQFTPDLLPGDITGNPMLEEVDGARRFVFQPGPVFTNLLLADEINRASPKTQSALLEAMQERRVSAMGESKKLPDPFFVFATQNPIELEGTYPLPEAQVDRFLFKLQVYRSDVASVERIIASREMGVSPEVNRVMSAEMLNKVFAMVKKVYLPPAIINYISRIVDATHPAEGNELTRHIRYGASPRAAIGLAAAARSAALLSGREHVGFEDVKRVATPILRHRLILDYQAKLDGLTPDGVVSELLEKVTPENRELPNSLKAAKI